MNEVIRMEKQTRINKYKDLREEMKEEVAINQHQSVPAIDEDDDDFLAFLPRDEKPKLDDTLMEPLSYETLKKDNEEVRVALNEAKVNVGKEQYNTRLDILNKIKQEEHVPAHGGYVEEDIEESHKKMTLLEKLAAMSPEEDAEELRKFEEDLTVADLMKNQKKPKREKAVEETKTVESKRKQAIIEDEIDDDEEEESTVVTVLNYVIIVFIVVFIVLAFFIVKQLLF